VGAEVFQTLGLSESLCFFNTSKLLTKISFAYHYDTEQKKNYYHIQHVQNCTNSMEHVKNYNTSETFKAIKY
jgi:hypothetical protein